MKTKLVLFAPVALVALTFLTGHASAAATVHQGSFCTPTRPADATNLTLGQFGPSGTPGGGRVSCPAFVVNGPNATVNIGAYDRNNNTISGGDVECTVFFLDAAGISQRNVPLKTSGSSANVMSRSTASLSTSGTFSIFLDCFIPGIDGASGGVSHLASYTIFQ
jgi:hypothetical protein